MYRAWYYPRGLGKYCYGKGGDTENIYIERIYIYIYIERERERDRQTDRQTG
jgi:hypothetical protein